MTLKRVLTGAGMTAVVAGSLVFGAQAAHAAPAALTAPVVVADVADPEDTTPVVPEDTTPVEPTDPADSEEVPLPTDPPTLPEENPLPESGPSPAPSLPSYTIPPFTPDTTYVAPVPVDESELNAPGPVPMTLSSSTVTPGSTVVISMGENHGKDARDIWLYSTPRYLGGFTANLAGEFTVVIPADATPGQHRLVVSGGGAGLVGWAWITIVSPGSTLAETGLPTGLPIGIGSVLLAAGAALVAVRGSKVAARRS